MRCTCVVVVVMVSAVVVLFRGLLPLTSLNIKTHANFDFFSLLREIIRRRPGGHEKPQFDIEKCSIGRNTLYNNF